MGNIFSGLLGKQGSSEQQPDAAGQSVGDTGADSLFSQLNERITSLENRIDRLEEELRQLSKREQQSAGVSKVDSKDNELTMSVYGQQRQLFLAAPTTDGGRTDWEKHLSTYYNGWGKRQFYLARYAGCHCYSYDQCVAVYKTSV